MRPRKFTTPTTPITIDGENKVRGSYVLDNKAAGPGRLKGKVWGHETAAYLKAIERDNLDPIQLRCSSPTRLELSKQRKAERELLTAVKLIPKSSEPYKYLGVLSLEQGEFEKAERQLEESLKRGYAPDVLTLLGVSKSRLDKLRSAKVAFKRAMNIDPDYKEAYYNLALTFSYTKHYKAIKLLLKALDIDNSYAAALRELGWAFKLRGKPSEAERHLKQAIKLDKSDTWAYIYFGNLMWSKGESNEAEKAYKAAIKVCPKEGTPYWCLADFYKHHGRLKQSEDLYQKAVRLDPDSAVANSRLGLFLMQIGARERAREYLERTLKLDPGFERVQAALDELRR